MADKNKALEAWVNKYGAGKVTGGTALDSWVNKYSNYTPKPVDTRTAAHNNEQRKADRQQRLSAASVSPLVLPTANQPAVLPTFTQAMQQTNARYMQELQETMETEDQREPTFGERVKNILSGAGKGYAGSAFASGAAMADAMGGPAAKSVYEEELATIETRREALLADMKRPGISAAEREEQMWQLQQYDERIRVLSESINANEQAGAAGYKAAEELTQSGAKDVEKAKKGLGDVGSAVVDASVSGIQMAGDVLASAATMGAVNPLTVSAYRAAGSAASEAKQSGATEQQALSRGAMEFAKTWAVNKLLNTSAIAKKIGGEGVADDFVETVANKLADKLAKTAGGKSAITTLTKFMASGLGEAFEESLEAAPDPALDALAFGDAKQLGQYASPEYWAEMLYDGLIGGILGFIGGGVDVVTEGTRAAGNALAGRNRAQAGAQMPQGGAQTQTRVTTPAQQNALTAPQTGVQGQKENASTGEAETPRVSMADFANIESPIWNAVDYNDNATKRAIQEQTHQEMEASGRVIAVPQETTEQVAQSFPDLRTMKKAERAPILKQKIDELKTSLRTFLNGLKGGSYEFEVNGNILEAKLYDTGVREVMKNITQDKASMLYTTEEIFRNAQYMYSTPDYEGNPNIYRWNYFYTPVKIGDETVGVRIAVRDMAETTVDGKRGQESQIYNWGIKKPPALDGGSPSNKAPSSGASSADGTGETTSPVDTMISSPERSVKTDPMSVKLTQAQKGTEAAVPKALAMIEAGTARATVAEETGLYQADNGVLRNKFGTVVYIPERGGAGVANAPLEAAPSGQTDTAEEDYAKFERDAIYGRIDEEGNPVDIPAEQTERENEQAQAAAEQTQAMQPSEARAAIDAFISGESNTVPASELGLTEKPQERKTAGEAVSDAAHFVYRKMVDAGEAVARVGKTVKDSALYAFYNQARASGNAATNMLVDAQTNTKGEYVGEALMDIFQPIIDKGERYYSNFQMFLWHRHNQNRMSLENPQRVNDAEFAYERYKTEHPELRRFDDARIRELANYEGPYQEAAKGYVRALDALQRARNVKNKPVFGDEYTAEDSKAIADRLLRENPEFAELAKRVYQYERNLMQYRIDSGLVTQQQADMWAEMYPNYVPTARAKEQTGGKKKGKHAKTSTTVKTAEGGDTQLLPIHVALASQTRSVVREGSKNRFGQRLLDVRDELGGFATEITETEDNIGEMDLDSRETVLDDSQLKNSFTIYKDGKAYTMKVTGDLFEAIDALTPSGREDNALMKALQGSNNLFKVLITGYNPLFTIRNAIKDQQAVMINSKNYAEYAKQYPQAIKEIMTNGQYWQQYKALGGTTSSVLNYETDKLDAPKGLGKVSARIEAINMGVEQAPRLAEFMATVKSGDGSMENLMQAMLNAQDVTTNFGRSGTWGKQLNKYAVPFLNPSIQGADKFVRNLTERRDFKSWLSLAAKCAIFGFAAPVLNGLLYSDDEEWDDLKDRDKNMYYLFKIGDGKWLKIHRGREFSAMSFMGALIKDVAKGEQVSVGDYLKEIYNQIGPTNPMDNNITAAWVGAKLFDADNPGETWYGGDIESQRLQGYAPGDRYDEKTDVVSKWIGGKLNISPKKLNYLIDQYTGVLGDVLLPMLSPQAERDMLSSAFTIDSVRSNKYSEEFYNTMDQLEYAKNDPAATGVDKILHRYWNKQNGIVSDVNAAIREIEADTELSDKEKKERTRDQTAIRNAAQAAALESLDAYRAAAEKAYAAAEGSEDERVEAAYREANRELFGAEYAMQTYNKQAYESASPIVEAGVSWDTYFDYYFSSRGAKTKAAKRAVVNGMDIGDDERMLLYEGVVATEADLANMAEMESNGIEPETVQKIAYTIDGVEPEAGKSDVSAQQKYTTIAAMAELSDAEKLAAILAYDPSEDATAYEEYAAAYDAGLSVKAFDDYRVKVSGIASDKDASGKTITGSKKEKVVAAIDALNISDEKKDFLFLLDYAESGLSDTPWHSDRYAGQLPTAANNYRKQSGGLSTNSIRSANSIRGKRNLR